GRLPRIGREEAAEHAERGGLPAAVGSEEAADLSAGHLQIEPLHHGSRPERLAQAVHVDGERCGRHRDTCTSSGWPGWSPWSALERASTRNTSLLRASPA